MRRALIAIGIFVGLTGLPAVAAEATPATKPTTEKVTEAAPALWVVRGPKGTVYMLGSIHRLPKNIHWQTPTIMTAMAKADTFVFELPMDENTREHIAQMFFANGLMPFSQSLPSLFDQELRDEYRQVITTTNTDPTPIVYLRPWLAAMVLEGAAEGTTKLLASEGVDNRVYADAVKRKGMQFRALETPEFQMRLLAGDGDLEAEFGALKIAFQHILSDRAGPNVDVLLAAWEKGDTRAIDTQFGSGNKTVSPQFTKTLLEDRNRAWVPQIVAMLNEPHVFFVTVGAAHLAGRVGVPNLLRAGGYKVDGP